MVRRRARGLIAAGLAIPLCAAALWSRSSAAQSPGGTPPSRASGPAEAAAAVPGTRGAPRQTGAIRGIVTDGDFDAPLPLAAVTIVETGQRTTTSSEGTFAISDVPPGRYTVVVSRDGYARRIMSSVTVAAGRLTDLEVLLTGDFTDMEPFVVQELEVAGTEASLLRLRLDSPSFIDAVSAELMSRAGAGDAASALNLVAGATAQDGRFAVIRGLPDRFVVSLLSGARLPTADENKRAVQLDQFPSAAIESVLVSKTFTPDQQGDASGGAVDVVLKGVPDETRIEFRGQIGFNSQVSERTGFLTYSGGGVGTWGRSRGTRAIPEPDVDGVRTWEGAAGVQPGQAPVDSKWSLSAGGRHVFDTGLRVGGFASFFYERESDHFENGIDDALWVAQPGAPMTPRTIQGSPEYDGDSGEFIGGDFKTALFDVTRSTQSVQWGGLGTAGAEYEGHSIRVTYLYTHTAEDTATLAEDTRGKSYFFPEYDPTDPTAFGNRPQDRSAAPWLRTETLEYTERSTRTLIIGGSHTLAMDGFGSDGFLRFSSPVVDWRVARSTATLDQPDKRQFGALWLPPSFSPGAPPFLPPFEIPAEFRPFKPAQNFLLGNFQRTFKEIEERSDQYAIDLRLPFRQWTGDEGYLKFGAFRDTVVRTFDQETFSNFNDNSARLEADFSQSWSAIFPLENHPISDGPPFIDVDYRGNQRITAWYAMADLPAMPSLRFIGGARWETTALGIVNIPEENATWFPPDSTAPVLLNPGDADVNFRQEDLLPSLGFVLTPVERVTLRGSWSRTIARQTFKELTPVQQQEFLGGDVFIGNPELQMSAVVNYDLRLDLTPSDGGLLSASWFKKDITDPIENVQRLAAGFSYTTAVNYPRGKIDGFELEARQDLGAVWDHLRGLSIGANATFIDSIVTLPDDEATAFEAPSLLAPMPTRRMTNAPDRLYNLYCTWDVPDLGTQLSLFYTVRGDTLIAGAGQSDGNLVPSVFAREIGTLNLSITQSLGRFLKLSFQARNLTNPAIETVYRSEYIGADVLRTSYRKGIDYAIGLSARFTF